MPLSLTVVDSFNTQQSYGGFDYTVDFNPAGTHCAVGVVNGAGRGGSSAEVWIYKLATGHWSKVATLVTPAGVGWDYEAYHVAIADSLTVLSVGSNSESIQRWLNTGGDTWAASSAFLADSPNYGYNRAVMSADGNVAFACGDYNGEQNGKLWTGMNGTKTLRQTFSAASDAIWAGALSSDGKRLVIARDIGYAGTLTLQVWTSTTLGTSSWTLANSYTLGDTETHGMKMTTDMSLIAVSALAGALSRIKIFQNTGGSTYSEIGAYRYVPDDYNLMGGFSLSDTGGLLVANEQDPAQGRLYTEDNVAAVSGLTTLDEQHAYIGASTDWVVTTAINRAGTWAVIRGGGDYTAGQNNLLFCSVAVLPPLFWTGHVQSVEARS